MCRSKNFDAEDQMFSLELERRRERACIVAGCREAAASWQLLRLIWHSHNHKTAFADRTVCKAFSTYVVVNGYRNGSRFLKKYSDRSCVNHEDDVTPCVAKRINSNSVECH
eukprot:scaffold7652_cov80-Skeletonema_marinoi.AAC.4